MLMATTIDRRFSMIDSPAHYARLVGAFSMLTDGGLAAIPEVDDGYVNNTGSELRDSDSNSSKSQADLLSLTPIQTTCKPDQQVGVTVNDVSHNSSQQSCRSFVKRASLVEALSSEKLEKTTAPLTTPPINSYVVDDCTYWVSDTSAPVPCGHVIPAQTNSLQRYQAYRRANSVGVPRVRATTTLQRRLADSTQNLFEGNPISKLIRRNSSFDSADRRKPSLQNKSSLKDLLDVSRLRRCRTLSSLITDKTTDSQPESSMTSPSKRLPPQTMTPMPPRPRRETTFCVTGITSTTIQRTVRSTSKQRPDSSDSGFMDDSPKTTYSYESPETTMPCRSRRFNVTPPSETTSQQYNTNQLATPRPKRAVFVKSTSSKITRAATSKLNLPSRLMEPADGSTTKQTRMRRCRSQPLHVQSTIIAQPQPDQSGGTTIAIDDGIYIDASDDDDDDDEPCPLMHSSSTPHAHRVQQSTPETWQRDSRSSTYSTASSLTTASGYGSDTKETRRATYAAAIWDHVTLQPEDLPFRQGEMIELVEWSPRSELWYGIRQSQYGWFPANYVKVLHDQDEASPRNSVEIAVNNRSDSAKWQTMRTNVIQEIVSTERDYVKLLENLVDGFLQQARRRSDMFSTAQLTVLFSNLEKIFDLHKKFLSSLETAITDWSSLHDSNIGQSFLVYQNAFNIYSDYCNNHPLATSELVRLYNVPRYRHFFEACRLLRDMTQLGLDAFLLSPVQRICKYHLQLEELSKWTPESHADYSQTADAVRAMREVAARINERKRRLESVQKLILWQRSVDGWRGPDVLELSSDMLHSGEVVYRCFHANGVGWIRDIEMFLFDGQVLLCKQDMFRANQFNFRDRLFTKDCSIVPVPDGKESQFGCSVKHAFKVFVKTPQQSCCFLFCCKCRKDKQAWLTAFQQEQRLSRNPPTKDELRIATSLLDQMENMTCQHESRSAQQKPQNISRRSRPNSLNRNKWNFLNVRRPSKS